MSAVEHFCSMTAVSSPSAWVIPCFLTFSLIFGLRFLIVKDYTDIFFIQEIITVLCEALALIALWKTAAKDNLEVSEEKLSDIPVRKNSIPKMENPAKPAKKKNRRKRYSFEHLPALTTATHNADAVHQPPIGDIQPEPPTSEEEAVNASPTPDALPTGKTPTVMKDANNNNVAAKKSTRPVPEYIKEVTKRTYIVGLNPVGGKKKKKKSKKGSNPPSSSPTHQSPTDSACVNPVPVHQSAYPNLVISHTNEPERKVLKPVDQQTLQHPQFRKYKSKNQSDDIENKKRLRRQHQVIITQKEDFAPSRYYTSLQICESQLYEFLTLYRLKEKQLQSRNFPILSDTFVNRIQGQEDVASQLQSSDDPTTLHRYCCRCGASYSIRNSVEYFSEEEDFCNFHPGKIYKATGRYSCCDGASGAPGCRFHQYHVSSATDLRHACFKSTQKIYREDHKPHVYALDCEMVYTTIGMSVARVSLVRLDGTVALDATIMPDYPVLDYNTEFSGISRKDYAGQSYDLKTIQAILLDMIDADTILVGHALENDLRFLHLVHRNIVDTQAVFAGSQGRRRRLKDLAWEFLGKEIQTSIHGHCGIEDARTCANLMLAKIASPRLQPSFAPKSESYHPKPATYHHCQDCVNFRHMYAGERLYFPR